MLRYIYGLQSQLALSLPQPPFYFTQIISFLDVMLRWNHLFFYLGLIIPNLPILSSFANFSFPIPTDDLVFLNWNWVHPTSWDPSKTSYHITLLSFFVFCIRGEDVSYIQSEFLHTTIDPALFHLCTTFLYQLLNSHLIHICFQAVIGMKYELLRGLVATNVSWYYLYYFELCQNDPGQNKLAIHIKWAFLFLAFCLFFHVNIL